MNTTLLRDLDILHCTGSKFLSKAIMKVDKSEYSHSAIFVTIHGKPFVIDSQRDGTNLRPFDEWIEKYNYAFKVDRDMSMSYNTTQERLAIAFAYVGHTGYDIESLFIRQPIKIITGKWRDRGNKEDDKLYCSEYVATVHQHPLAERMSPKDLEKYCRSNPKYTTVAHREKNSNEIIYI